MATKLYSYPYTDRQLQQLTSQARQQELGGRGRDGVGEQGGAFQAGAPTVRMDRDRNDGWRWSAAKLSNGVVALAIAFSTVLLLYMLVAGVQDTVTGAKKLARGEDYPGGDSVRPMSDPSGSTGEDWSREVQGCPSRATDHVGGQEDACAYDGRVYALGKGTDSGPWAALMIPPEGRSQVDAHGSNIIQLPDRTLLATWFSGAEDDDGVSIVVSRLEAGSMAWTAPAVVSAESGRSAQNPVLFFDSDTEVTYLLHTSQVSYSGQGTSEVRWLKSEDGGLTWSTPNALFRDAGAFVRNQMLRSKSGGWLLPMYYTPHGFGDFASHYSVLKWTEDKGTTWMEAPMTEPGEWRAQPTVTRLKNGHLFGFHRDREGMYLYSTTSTDDGKTWTKAKRSKLPNNNSGIQVTTLKSGVLALVFNNLQGNPRNPLSVALSEDDGETWPYVRDLDIDIRGDFSYPSIIEGQDDLLHITYTYNRETIKYVRVSPTWVKHGATVGPFDGSDKPL